MPCSLEAAQEAKPSAEPSPKSGSDSEQEAAQGQRSSRKALAKAVPGGKSDKEPPQKWVQCAKCSLWRQVQPRTSLLETSCICQLPCLLEVVADLWRGKGCLSTRQVSPYAELTSMAGTVHSSKQQTPSVCRCRTLSRMTTSQTTGSAQTMCGTQHSPRAVCPRPCQTRRLMQSWPSRCAAGCGACCQHAAMQLPLTLKALCCVQQAELEVENVLQLQALAPAYQLEQAP